MIVYSKSVVNSYKLMNCSIVPVYSIERPKTIVITYYLFVFYSKTQNLQQNQKSHFSSLRIGRTQHSERKLKKGSNVISINSEYKSVNITIIILNAWLKIYLHYNT